MKLAVVISSNEPENAWNAFRLANLALEKKDTMNVFLLNGGVECLEDNGKYSTKTLSGQFEEKGGRVLACGTCIKGRKMGEVCDISNMERLYNVIRESDRIVFL